MSRRHSRIAALFVSASIAALLIAAAPVRSETEVAPSYMADVQAKIAKGDLRGAEIQLRNAARANPNDPLVHIELAKLYLRMPNLPNAEAEARLARQDKGPADDVDPLLAQALLEQQKFTELFRDVKPDDRGDKAEAEVRLTLGLAHLNLQETTEAEPLLAKAESLDPSSPGPKAAMAQLLLNRGDIARAQTEIAAATAIAPDDPAVMRVNALVLLAQNDNDGALKVLGDLLAKYPDNIPALGLRGALLIRENKLAEAQAVLDHALKLAPRSAGVVYYHALLLARQGKLQEADAQLTSMSTAFNNVPVAYYLQGAVKYRLGQYQQAAADLSKYVARVPKATEARRLLAQIDIQQHDYKSAINELKPMVDSNPADADSIALLAQAYSATGNRRNDALELYQRLVTLQPENERAAVSLDLLKIQTGDVEQGLDQLNKIAESAQGAAVAGPPLVMAELRAGRASDAARSAQALVDRNPQDSVARTLLGAMEMAEGKTAEGAATFKAIVDKDPTLLGPRRDLARADIALGKLDDAKAVLQGLLKQHPDSIVDTVSLASLEAQQKDDSAAADLLRKAQQNAPTDPTPGLALLQIYGQEKAWDKAESYGRELELRFTGNRQVVSEIAALRAAAGDAKGAAREFAQLPEATPNDVGLLTTYAQYQSAAGDKAGARATLQQALAADPQNFSLMSQLANFDFDDAGIDKALATAQSFAAGQPLAAELISAGLYERAKRLDDAIATLTAAMKRTPQSPVAIKLASDLFEKGERSQGVDLLRTWVKDHPDGRDAQFILATLYERENDTAAAQQAYEAAYKSAPTNWITANNLAVIYEGKKDPRARALAEQAFYLSPSPQTADTYGWALVQSGDPAEGLRLLRRAQAGMPNYAVVLYHLAVALKDTGDTSEARDILKKVVDSGAAFADQNAAKELLQELQRG
jgi:cellulose synthase operon protein C